MNITPRNMTVQALFQSTFFRIPRFQRPYSWDRANLEDFWADVIETESKDYFIGSMVFYAKSNNQIMNVVDGQQRLTTITIFFAALRDLLSSVGEGGLATGIQNIIERLDITTSQPRFVLQTETSYPYFQDHIQKMGEPELAINPGAEETGMASAYDFALEGFSSLLEPIQTSSASPRRKATSIRRKLEGLRDSLLSLDVIVVQLDNEDDAYIVFETLNTRGKDLEPKDLIKNHLTRLLPPRSQDIDAAKIKWNNLLKAIDASAANINPSQYLHHNWLSRYDYTPEKTLYRRVKRQVGRNDAMAYLDGLLEDVEPYRRIFEPDNFLWSRQEQNLKDSLSALAVFKVRQPTPLLLSLLRAYSAGRLSLRQVKIALAAIERFHFLYTAIAGQSSSGGISMMYAAVARDLTSETNAQARGKRLQEFRRRLRERTRDEDVFSAGFGNLRYSSVDTKGKPLVAYVLKRADQLLRTTDAAVAYERMTIEHIAPQNPADPGHLVDEYPSIGNLILVSEDLNTRLRNRPFAEKKRILRRARVPMDEVLASAEEWGPDQIQQRTQVLSRLIFTRA
jgi:hypothetical protein